MNKNNHYLLILIALLICFCKVKLLAQKSSIINNSLGEVNTRWIDQDLNLINPSLPLSNDQLLQLHFDLVEDSLILKTDRCLSDEQEKKRAFVLQKLKEYKERGIFPVNTFHQEPTPYFVDINNTHCAVAYLLKETGHESLIKNIRENHNNYYINDLVNIYPNLLQWVVENGFAIEEVAWMQPMYYGPTQEIHPVGNDGGFEGKINVMNVSPDESLLYFAGDFNNVDGVASNSIIAWDGNNWISFGDAILGEIFDIHFHNNTMYIAGDFRLNGELEKSNIALWDNGQWTPLQQGNTGAIYTMETYQNKLYIGGAFQTLDDIEMPYLAYYNDEQQQWSNSAPIVENGILTTLSNIFSVNDTVRCFEVFQDILYVGGDFTLTSPYLDHPNVIQHKVKNLAKWYGYIWLDTPNTVIEQVNFMTAIGDSLYLSGPVNSYNQYLFIHSNDTIVDAQPFCWYPDNGKPLSIYGYIYHDQEGYFYGNLKPGSTLGAGGFFHYRSSYNTYLNGNFNDQITAAAVFKGNIYFAGDFDIVFDEPFNRLAYSSWGAPTVNTQEIVPNKNDVIFYTSDKKLIVETTQVESDATINVYTTSGQLMKVFTLKEKMKSTFDLNELTSGIYVFQYKDKFIQQSKMIALF